MAYNPFTLQGKTVLVTGASSGIGRAVAIECARMGAVVVASGRNQQRLAETLSCMEGKTHQIIAADLAVDSSIDRMLAEIRKLDGVVHCAGINKWSPITFMKKDAFTEIMQTNTFAPIFLTQQLFKHKKLNKEASIVFLSSIGGVYNTSVGNTMYGISKNALQTFMRSAALEFSMQKIRCNSICPGRVETNMIQSNTMMTEEDIQRDMQMYPLSRYGKPEEIAYAAVYLLSDATKWITGTSMVIDGGRTLK